MRKLVAITTLAAGILLIVVPRYILPACEYEGYSRMHCSDTAHAENIIGALLLVIGAGALFLRSEKAMVACATASFLLYLMAFWLPDKFGYCQSPRMPCNYGMVPGIRFIAVVGAISMIIAIVGLARALRKKGHS